METPSGVPIEVVHSHHIRQGGKVEISRELAVTSEADPADKNTHGNEEGRAAEPLGWMLGRSLQLLVNTDRWPSHAVGENGAERCFPRLAKGVGQEGGLIVPWSGESLAFKGNNLTSISRVLDLTDVPLCLGSQAPRTSWHLPLTVFPHC